MQTKTRPFAGDGSTFEELIEVLMAMPGTQSDELARNEEQFKLLNQTGAEERQEGK